jgi:hypothetical protein
VHRPTRALLVATCLACIAVGGCGTESEPGSGSPDELTGVVVEVDSRGLGDVRGFTLRSEGETYEISIDPDQRFDDFPLSHLRDHLASAEPVRVEVEGRSGELFATSLTDA